MINQLAVVQLSDGRIMVKTLRNGSQPGLFTLTSFNAADIVDAIMHFVVAHSNGKKHSGIYNYANYGMTSWFQFAQFIKEKIASVCELHPVNSDEYPTPAARPKYSVLDTAKIRHDLNIVIPFWKDSAAKCIDALLSL